MSRDAKISLVWAGDERDFRLGIEQCLALEDNRDCGLRELMIRLGGQAWRVEDIREPLRLGLIGAGVDGTKARRMVDATVVPGRLMENVLPAFAVVAAAVQGDARDSVGKDKAAADATEPANGSPPPRSTVPAPSSASRRDKSGE